jgi:hypothetical protein
VLLDDECYPTTGEIGFIELPVEEAAALLKEWWEPKLHLRLRSYEEPLRELLQRLLPLTSTARPRHLLVQTASRWTAYFDNGWRGSDPFMIVASLAEHRCLGMRVAADPATWAGARRRVEVACPAAVWDVYGPEPLDDPELVLTAVRHLAAVDEGGGQWVFTNAGKPFPFEDVSVYSARRIRDRFPVELLLEYLRHFDIDLFNADFYSGPAVMVEIPLRQLPTWPTQKRSPIKEYPTFAAAREDRPRRKVFDWPRGYAFRGRAPRLWPPYPNQADG